MKKHGGPIPVTKLDEDWAVRLRGLSDGLFAIVMTLLLITLDNPQLKSGSSEADLRRNLISLSHQFLGYLLSFAVIGSYWIAHCRAFRGRFHIGTPLLIFNLLFLFCLSLLPFTTNLMTDHLDSRIAWALYSGNIVLVGVFHLCMVVRVDQRESIVRSAARARIYVAVVAPIIFLGSVGMAWVDLTLAHLLPLFAWPITALVRNRWSADERDATLPVEQPAD